jgi:O-antigen ligase
MLDKFSAFLLSVVLVFTVATNVRFSDSIGVSEILAGIYLSVRFLSIYILGIVSNRSLWGFFFIFLLILLFGSMFSLLSNKNVLLRDLAAYLYCFILVVTAYDNLIRSKYMVTFFSLSFIFVSSAYLLVTEVSSHFIPSFMYENFRLSGLSANPNQLALLVLVTFCYLLSFGKELLSSKWLIGALYVFYIYIALRTVSEALLISLFLGVAFLGVANYVRFSLRNFYYFSFSSAAIICFFAVLSYFTIKYFNFFDVLFDAVNINNQGSDRFILWFNGVESIKDSPLLGNGPGAHSGFYGPFEGVEAHNTFIDMLSQVGLIGTIVFFIFTFYLYHKGSLVDNASSFFIIIVLFSFSFFHFVLRQPLFWFCLFLPLLLYNSKYIKGR